MPGITDDTRIREIRALITPHEVMGEFAAHNVNIIEIHHQRIFTSLPAKGLFTDIECEARDAKQIAALVGALRAKGYSVETFDLD